MTIMTKELSREIKDNQHEQDDERYKPQKGDGFLLLGIALVVVAFFALWAVMAIRLN